MYQCLHDDHSSTSALGRSGFNRFFICWSLQWPTLRSHLLVSDVFNTVSSLCIALRILGDRILDELRDIVSTVLLRACFLLLQLAVLFCLLFGTALFGFATSSMFSAVVHVHVLFHLCFRQNRIAVFYDSVVRLWSSSFITTLLLVMGGSSRSTGL